MTAPALRVLLPVLFVSATSALAADQPPPPLFENLGTLHHPITTKSEQAQRYFDQGLRLVFAFNHEEAINSFQEAARLDPDAPMPYWGIALALGPNINADMDKTAARRANAAIQQAVARLTQASPQERAYIEALATRYSPGKKSTRHELNKAYADAMREAAKRFPDDADAAVLSAEALMDTQPWDYWTKEGRPKGRAEEIVSTLEAVLATHPDHPGACHYYIHAVEASRQPERALPCAQRLPGLMPGAGHLVHMPAHIYMRVGQYQAAVDRNAEAASVDHTYLEHRRLTGSYPTGYYAHNLHFLWAALLMEGRSAEAAKTAGELVKAIPAHEVANDMWLDFYAATPLLTSARFGRWEEVLQQPPPHSEWRYTTAIRHYARGLAFAAAGRFAEAERARASIHRAVRRLPKARTIELDTTRTLLKIAALTLSGEIAVRQQRYDAAVRLLREAVAAEDSLRYHEPPLWFAPVRQAFGAGLLDAGHAAEAEQMYREDLRRNPENGWALFGLAQSLRAQKKTDEAAAVDERFKAAWSRADVTLPPSQH
jgi:tetratricopeptide (TPR) repeat protein